MEVDSTEWRAVLQAVVSSAFPKHSPRNQELPLKVARATQFFSGFLHLLNGGLAFFARSDALGPVINSQAGRAALARPVPRHRSGVDRLSTSSLFLAPNARKSGATCLGIDDRPQTDLSEIQMLERGLELPGRPIAEAIEHGQREPGRFAFHAVARRRCRACCGFSARFAAARLASSGRFQRFGGCDFFFHGGATWNSRVNRHQVRDGAAILGRLVPVVVDLMLDHPGVDFGEIQFPVV